MPPPPPPPPPFPVAPCTACNALADTSWGRLSTPGMLSFGDYNATGQNRSSWRYYEIPFFVVRGSCRLAASVGVVFDELLFSLAYLRGRAAQVLGVIGGLVGAVFNSVNMKLTRYGRAASDPGAALRLFVCSPAGLDSAPSVLPGQSSGQVRHDAPASSRPGCRCDVGHGSCRVHGARDVRAL